MRAISRLIELGLILILLMAGTGAAQDDPAADFTYTSSGTAITITGYVGPGGDVFIPSTIDGLPVTRIGANAFQSNTKVTSVTIPDSVTSIGDYAFHDCDSLTLVTIPDSVTSIGTGAFISCTSLTSVTIPDSVTTIGEWAFAYCYSLTSMAIGNGVNSIGRSTFLNCSSLTSVTIGSGVTSIGYHAFYSCYSLTSVTIPDSVNSIGNEAFYRCISLTSVTIGSGVTSISSDAFTYCTSLTSVTIPESVTSISIYAFQGCTSLTTIEVDPRNTAYASVDGVLYDKTITMLLQCPKGKTSVTIPESVNSIGDSAFRFCTSLTSVTIPDSVNSISIYAFQGCTSLASVIIPESVNSIGSDAFQGCTSLTSVVIPNSVTSIGEWAFHDCTSLTSVTIPDSVNSIGRSAFQGCTSLTTIEVDPRNTAYASVDGVLYDKAITTLLQCPGGKTSVVIPDSVTNIGNQAFGGCTALTSVNIGSGVTSIGRSAFLSCNSLTSVTIPNRVTSIGEWAFAYCTSLTSMNFEGNAPTVGSWWAQYVPRTMIVYYHPGATGFTTPTWNGFPCYPIGEASIAVSKTANVTEAGVGDVVSYSIWVNNTGDVALTNITAYDNLTAHMENIGSLAPGGSLSFNQSYQVTGSDIGKVIVNNVTANGTTPSGALVGSFDTASVEAIAAIVVPVANFTANVTSGEAPLTVQFTDLSTNLPTFWAWDFENNIIVDSTEQNPSHTYNAAGSYTVRLVVNNSDGSDDEVKADYIVVSEALPFTYTIDNGEVTITGYTGPGGDVIIPSMIENLPVTSIGANAFRYNTNMTSVNIPNSVTTIDSNAFQRCTALTSVIIPDSVTSIETYAFENCASLTSVTIPDSVTNIRDYVFYGCTSLTSVTIPDSVTTISTSAFHTCTSLTSVSIPDNVTEIGNTAFFDCTSLTSVTFRSKVAFIGGSAFRGCTSLTSVAIPESVTNIGDYVFYGCTSLTSVTIPNSVTRISDSAFAYCISMTSMTFEGNAPILVTNWALNVPKTMIVYYYAGATGFTTPTWNGFPCYPIGEASIVVSKTANVTEAGLGDVIGYSIVVNNTGDVSLTSVLAYDNLTAHLENIGDLAPGQSFSFELTYQVTESDLCRPLVNNVTVNGTTTTGAEVESFSIETVEIASHPAISVSKTANVTEAEVGDVVGYTILVNNTGDISLENVTVYDNLTDQTENIGTLAAGGSYSFRLSHKMSAGDAGKVVVNNVTARGTTPCGVLVEGYGTASVTVKGVSRPAIAVNKIANVTEARVGDVVGYTIWVNNTGDVALNSVTAYDNLTGHLENIGSLAPGESFSFDQNYRVTEDDLCKALVNNVTATGTTTAGTEVKSFSIETVEIASHPAISVSKIANVTEARVGDVVGYTINVNNTGDVALNSVTAYDDLTGQKENIGTLAPGGKYSFSLSHKVAADDTGKVVVNNITVNGTSPCGILVSAFDTASVEAIAVSAPVANFSANVTSGVAPLTVAFTDLSTNSPTSWAWDFDNDSKVDSTEQSPSYTYSTTGTYTVNLTVSNADGSDNEIKTDLISVSGLVIAPVANFTVDRMSGVAPLTVSFTDLSTNSPTSWAWDFDNGGSVDSTEQSPSYTYSTAGMYTVKLVVSNAGGSDEEIKTDLVTVKGVSRPAIAVNKIANVTEARVGDVVGFTVWVNNTGGVALNSVKATDDLTGHRENIGSLAPGESFSFDQTYKVAEKDLCKPLVNRVSASGRAITGVRVENSSKKTIEMVSHPAIIVNKVASVTSASVGDVVGYTIWVNNTGDVSLKYVKAYDNQTSKIKNIGTLAPGGSYSFSLSHKVSAGDAGKVIVNKVTARGTTPCGDLVKGYGTASVTIKEASRPAIAVNKIANVTEAGSGDVVGYTIWVNNTGGIALDSVTAYDGLTGHRENIGSLASGESFSFDQTYKVAEKDLCKPLVNRVSASGKAITGVRVENSSKKTVEMISHPAIIANKVASVTSASVGDVVGYTIWVNNTGDVSLKYVKAYDNRTGKIKNIGTLAPGSNYSFSLSHKVSAGDAGKVIINKVTARGTTPCGDLVKGYGTASVTVKEASHPATAEDKTANVTEAGSGDFVGNITEMNNTDELGTINSASVTNSSDDTSTVSASEVPEVHENPVDANTTTNNETSTLPGVLLENNGTIRPDFVNDIQVDVVQQKDHLLSSNATIIPGDELPNEYGQESTEQSSSSASDMANATEDCATPVAENESAMLKNETNALLAQRNSTDEFLAD